MSTSIAKYEEEALPELELAAFHEGESEVGELFLDDVTNWARNTWTKIRTPGTDERRIFLDTDKAVLTGATGGLGTLLGGPVGGVLGAAAGTALGSALAP